MGRRRFLTLLGSLGSLALLPACPIMNDIYQRVRNFVMAALLAFDRVTQILSENGIPVDPDMVNRVKASLSDILAAVEELKDATGDAKATLRKALAATLAIARNQLNRFWQTIAGKISDPNLSSVIKGLIDLLMSTLLGYQGELDLPQSIRGGPVKGITGPPMARDIDKFRKDFNEILREHGMSRYGI